MASRPDTADPTGSRPVADPYPSAAGGPPASRWAQRRRAARAIARRDLRALRSSPTPAVALGVALAGAAGTAWSVWSDRVWSDSGAGGRASPLYVPLFMAIILLTAALAMLSATSVARERESGTLEVLFYGPVDAQSFVAGKFAALLIAYVALGSILGLVFGAFAGLAGFPLGGDVLLGLLLSPLVAAVIVAFGIALATLCPSVRSAVLLLVAIIWITLAIHGGAALLGNLPPGVEAAAPVVAIFDAANRALSLVSPYAHLDRGIQAALGGNPAAPLVAVLTLLVSTAALLWAAALGLRWRGVRRS